MVSKKTVIKKAAEKIAAPVKKAVAKKASAKKAPAKTAPAKKAAAKKAIAQEQFYTMVCEAAYFAAQNDGNKKSSVDYWIEAEAAISGKFDVK